MIFDCHLDLAMNAVHWNRDLTKPLDQIRLRESGMVDKLDRGNGVVCFEEMSKGNIRFCIATQIAHSVSQNSPLPGWNSPEIAWAQTQAQLAWYRAMENRGSLKQITQAADLEFLLNHDQASCPIGFVLSLEGADSLLDLSFLGQAYQDGLRIVGPAHYGPGRYAAGTGETAGFTEIGFDLLKEMTALKMILDVTHLTDKGFDQALEQFGGPLIASHHNCRKLVDHQRQLTDQQIRQLLDRGAIIGVALDAWMLIPNWKRGETTPDETGVSLHNVADQIEHVCQIAGNANHSVIGSDLDGGFGHEQTPKEVTTICKINLLDAILEKRGFPEIDRKKIMHANAIEFFRRHLPHQSSVKTGPGSTDSSN